jgi:hypothetical protein
VKLTRRQIVIAAAGSAAVAKALAQSTSDLEKTARDNVQRNADTLAKFAIPMATEPAFQFKA